MYGGKPDDSLTKLRHARYREIAETNSSVLRPERLPPTERTAFQYSLRVHSADYDLEESKRGSH